MGTKWKIKSKYLSSSSGFGLYAKLGFAYGVRGILEASAVQLERRIVEIGMQYGCGEVLTVSRGCVVKDSTANERTSHGYS